MNYQEIKLELRKASNMLAAGDVAGADKTIRAMVGKGLMLADIDANLTQDEIRTLREFSENK